MELDNQLKELSFEMMKIEMMKLSIENSYSFSKMTGNRGSNYATKEGFYYGVIEEDKKGYALSLEFNELLLSSGKNFNSFVNGPDATRIAVENLLYKYGLKYPISWNYVSQTSNELIYEYDRSDKIDENHAKYLREVEAKLQQKEIDADIHKRLVLAGEYYAKLHKLFSKYYNNENIDELNSKQSL
jgi:hypothetical protein